MMQCFGKYKGDRLCDICKKIDRVAFDDCSQMYLDDIKACNYYKECKHYKQKKEIEWATDPWTGIDESYEVIKKICTLHNRNCTPNYSCAEHIKLGG